MVNISAMLQDAEAIKQSRQATKMNDLELQSAQAGIERQNKLQDLIPSAVSGDRQALNNVASIDPESAKQIQDYLSNASDQEKAEITERTRATGQLALFVKQSPDKASAYVQAIERARQMGIDVSSFPQQYSPEVDQMLDMAIAQSREIEDMLRPASQPTLKEIADPNSPTGTRYVRSEDAINQPGKPASGTNLTVGPDGTVQLTQGRGVQAMTKTVTNQAQEDVISKTVSLDRLEGVVDSFDPKFLTVSNRLGNSWTAVKEKYQIGDISPSDEKELAEYTQFKSEALSNLNQYIKDITGAAMSEAEANRIRQAMPDPGEGIFDGDSPTEFISKYKSAINSLKVARARQQYALKNSQNWEDISLASMKDILKQEQQRFFEEAGWDDSLDEDQKAAIVGQVKERLKNEYGF